MKITFLNLILIFTFKGPNLAEKFTNFLLRLLLNVTEVTTEQKKWPKISTNCVKRSFF